MCKRQKSEWQKPGQLTVLHFVNFLNKLKPVFMKPIIALYCTSSKEKGKAWHSPSIFESLSVINYTYILPVDYLTLRRNVSPKNAT